MFVLQLSKMAQSFTDLPKRIKVIGEDNVSPTLSDANTHVLTQPVDQA